MQGNSQFTITGQLSYVKDGGLYSNGDSGQIRIRINVAGDMIGNTKVNPHGLFLGIRYSSADINKAAFQEFTHRLIKGSYVLVSGVVKPKPASGKYPASLSLDASWKDVFVSQASIPYKNRVVFTGEVVSTDTHAIGVKYSYNTRGNNPQWKDREFVFSSPSQLSPRDPRERIYIEGKVFGLNPRDNSECMWLMAEDII